MLLESSAQDTKPPSPSSSAQAASDEKLSAQAWAAGAFLEKALPRAPKSLLDASRPPFSFTYGGKSSRELFKDAGYGLFCHWGSRSVNADGSKKDYYTAVKEFDVNAFANQVDEAGAKFVIFTIIHERHELAFPSAVMDSICAGHTSTQRDLYADMYTALNAKGIRMMFYWNMHASKEKPDWHDGSKWATDKVWFVQKHYDLVEEIGNRYGDRLAGWWLDHCYDNDPRLPADVRNWGAKFDFEVTRIFPFANQDLFGWWNLPPFYSFAERENVTGALCNAWLTGLAFRPDLGRFANNSVSDSAAACAHYYADIAAYTPLLAPGLDARQFIRFAAEQLLSDAGGA